MGSGPPLKDTDIYIYNAYTVCTALAVGIPYNIIIYVYISNISRLIIKNLLIIIIIFEDPPPEKFRKSAFWVFVFLLVVEKKMLQFMFEIKNKPKYDNCVNKLWAKL